MSQTNRVLAAAAAVLSVLAFKATDAQANCCYTYSYDNGLYFEGVSDGDVVVQRADTSTPIGELFQKLQGGTTYSHALSIENNAGTSISHQYVDVASAAEGSSCSKPISTGWLNGASPGYYFRQGNAGGHGWRDGYKVSGLNSSCPYASNLNSSGITAYRYVLANLIAKDGTAINNTCTGLLRYKCGVNVAKDFYVNGNVMKTELYPVIYALAYDECMGTGSGDLGFFSQLGCLGTSSSTICRRAAWQLANTIVLNRPADNSDLRGSWSSYWPGNHTVLSPKGLTIGKNLSVARKKVLPPAYVYTCDSNLCSSGSGR